MDAPPKKEASAPFIQVAQFWRSKGLNVPEILLADLSKGFLLLSDFGDTLLLNKLLAHQHNTDYVDTLYRRCIDDLLIIQNSFTPSAQADASAIGLPPYDRALLQSEVHLFSDWLVTRKIGYTLQSNEIDLLEDTFRQLIDNALNQPRVPVHRDYHSRNIMLVDGDSTLGHLDFQDAVFGPITYDLVSLLRDCYIEWPQARITEWLCYYQRQATKMGLLDVGLEQLTRWFDLMGMQRHLKASGIFARLSLRDGKHGYLDDIPLTLAYIESVSARYPEFAEFGTWLTNAILPRLPVIEEKAQQQEESDSR